MSKKLPLFLLFIFISQFIILAFNPVDRGDWALENFLVLCFLSTLLLTHKKFPLSNISYSLIFLFLCLHEIGAHYTYAKVPYDFITFNGLTINEIFGWQRNHFDRLVHFLFGLLLAYPIRELYYRIADSKGFWAYFFPLELTMAASMMFELFEWAAAEFFGGELGIAYLGSQGDIWDAQKDMGLASLGALIAMLITILINLKLQPDFIKEWKDSFKIKEKRPLGEQEIQRFLKNK